MVISAEGAVYTNEKLIGFGHGAAPRAQIRGLFVCTQTLHEISRCEDLFTAKQVLRLLGASLHGDGVRRANIAQALYEVLALQSSGRGG